MGKIKIEDESGDRKYFTIIPNYILNHSSHWDREVYIQMKRITGENGTCWTSRNTLAKQCGMSLDRLKKSLRYLVDHKWIEKIGERDVVTKGGIQQVNEYRIVDLWNVNNDFYQEKYKGGSSGTPPLAKGGSPFHQRGVVEGLKGGSSESRKEDPNTIRSLEEEHTQSVDFNSFWEKYPRKTGKGEALRSWRKLRPSKEMSERIVASVLAHKEGRDWKKEDGRFIPLPATFLNQGRYDDEVSISKGGVIKL